MLSFLPISIVHLIVFLGIVGGVISSIPLLRQLLPAHQIILRVLSIAIFGFGLYLEGSLSNEAEWQDKVQALEKRIAESAVKASKIDARVVAKSVANKQAIQTTSKTITEYIEHEVTVYDNTCRIPESVITAHNASALNDPLALVVTTELHNSLAVKMAPKK